MQGILYFPQVKCKWDTHYSPGLQYSEFGFKQFMKWENFPNFPRSLMCAVSQDVRAYGISSTVIIGEACALTEWKKFYACLSGSCQCVCFKHRICFYVIFTHPPVAVRWVAFVRAMVTCHIAKRSTPKHSARSRGVWRWWRFQNLLLHPLPFSLPFYFSLGFLKFSHNLQAL